MTDNRMKPYKPLPSSSLEFCQGYNAAVQKANEIIKSLDIKNTYLAEFLLEAEQENKALQVELQAKRSLAEAYKKYYDSVLDEFAERLSKESAPAISCDLFEQVVRTSDINDLIKEMKGEKNE